MAQRAAAGLLAVAALTGTFPVAAAPKVDIQEVVFTQKDDDKAAQKRLKKIRRLLRDAAKRADFGDAKVVRLSVTVARFEVEQKDDVLRVTCTLVGRLKGGPSARSHVSFGGRPDKRKKLEEQVLSTVTDGVMTRLAQLARERAEAPPTP
jgi:hypothetical protein